MLGLLLDRYEKSLLSEGRNRRTIHIVQRMTKSEFPEYYDSASIEYEEIHRQLGELESKGLITLVWRGKKEGHILEKCVLRDESVENAYAMLRRPTKSVKRKDILRILGCYEKELPSFTSGIRARLTEGKSVRQYVNEDEPKELERVLMLAAALLSNTQEQYLRSFSIRVFHDSKLAEKELHLACRILTDFERTDLPSDLETDEILEEFNIYRNPTFVFMKGDWPDARLSQGIGIFQDDLAMVQETLVMARQKPDVILTIENLTSFHRWNTREQRLGKHELVLYLAGYANHVKRHFLEEMYRLFPEIRFYHFGDIDCGGFRIWKNICCSTGIPIQTYGMDLATWQRYKETGRPLTAGDRKTLQMMLEDDFYAEQHALFKKMLEENRKLEQEGI